MNSAPLPQLWGVLYAEPNKNGEGKSCGNCMFADDAIKECAVVNAPISPDMVCGYHVEAGGKVSAELSGLDTVPGGTSCSRCRFFGDQKKTVTPLTVMGKKQMSGTCSAVDDGESPASVDPMGCCARWEDS